MEVNKEASESSSSEIECSCSISNFRSIASNKPGYSKTVQLNNNRELKKRDRFKVVIYPSGFNERTREYISLFVTRESFVELDVKVTCSLSHPDGRPLYSKFTRKHLGLETTLGWTAFCHRRQVLSDEVGVLDRGKLTILCKFEFFEPDGYPTYNQSERLIELSENFRRSFPDLDFSDFVLRSPTKAFGVHKCVLRARSPVLKAMLSLPNCSDELSLQGVSSDGLVAMLEFMYTGTLRHLSLAIAYELYTAADKYGMLCLKKFCSEILGNRLSVDNVLAMLLLSHGAKDSFLHTASLDCIVENMDEIKGRLEWIDMMQNNPELANNVIFYMEHKLDKNLKRHSRFL